MVWSGVLLLQELCVFAFIIAGTHGAIVGLGRPVTTDYVSFYAAGDLANVGAAPSAYDRAAHYAAEQRATASGVPYVYFFYPPTFLLLCTALARMPWAACCRAMATVSWFTPALAA